VLNQFLLDRFASLIKPPPRLLISEWAEVNVNLPPEGNSEPGRYRCARMPWQRKMLDSPLDSSANEIVWMLASQLGKTLCIIIIIGYFIDHRPTKILVVYPKLDDGKDWLRDKFLPLISETKCLDGKIKDPREHGSESRALNRKFPGGGLVVVGSSSTSSLRRLSARLIFQDEIDDFETTAQGDSMALADKRAETFHNAIKLKSSTPTHAGTSRVSAKYEASDKQKFFVPCQFCGHMQDLKWAQVKFTFERDGKDVRDTENAVYVCEKCEKHWTDQDRIAAINDPRADWIATGPASRIRGFHMNGLYRLIGRKTSFKSYLHEFAEDFLAAKKGGRETLMVWVNTFLAEPYSDPTEKIEWHPLWERSQHETYSAKCVPLEVALILADIDVQKDRIEISTQGIGDQEEMWWLENHVVYGDFDQPHIQQQVDDFLLKKYPREDGVELKITATAIDSAHKTQAVYKFCATRQNRRVWAVRGSATPYAPLVTPSTKRHYGITLWMVGTDTAKDLIFDRLALTDEGARYVHFPKSFPESFFRQLCSEEISDTFERGVHKRKYIKTQARNESLDKFVYGLACLAILKPSERWIKSQTPAKKEYALEPEKKLEEEKTEPPKPIQKPKSPRVSNRPKWAGGMFNPLGL
jgi:phage terminase large subunit GpA-like protein